MKKIFLWLFIAGSANANPPKHQQSDKVQTEKPSNQNQKLENSEGLKVISLNKGSSYEKLSLKPGDVIKSVNGKPVNSPSETMALFELLKKSGKIEIDVLRGEKTQKMIYEVK